LLKKNKTGDRDEDILEVMLCPAFGCRGYMGRAGFGELGVSLETLLSPYVR
jgi:hypothetical protein